MLNPKKEETIGEGPSKAVKRYRSHSVPIYGSMAPAFEGSKHKRRPTKWKNRSAK